MPLQLFISRRAAREIDRVAEWYAADVVRTAGAYIDLMKIKTGTGRLYPRVRTIFDTEAARVGLGTAGPLPA